MQEQDKLRNRPRGRFERLNVVIAILIAGWVPSILMLGVSYTILTKTLESKIQRDRQSFVQLIAHLVGDDLAAPSKIVPNEMRNELDETLAIALDLRFERFG